MLLYRVSPLLYSLIRDDYQQIPSLLGKSYVKKYERGDVGNNYSVKIAKEFLLCCFKMR